MLAYNYSPAVKGRPLMSRLSRILQGIDGVLPLGWPQEPAAMAEDLNAYRHAALKQTGENDV